MPSGWVRLGIHQTINHDDHGAHDDDGVDHCGHGGHDGVDGGDGGNDDSNDADVDNDHGQRFVLSLCNLYVISLSLGWARPAIHRPTNHDRRGAYDDDNDGNDDGDRGERWMGIEWADKQTLQPCEQKGGLVRDLGGHHGHGHSNADFPFLFFLCVLWMGSTRDPPRHQS